MKRCRGDEEMGSSGSESGLPAKGGGLAAGEMEVDAVDGAVARGVIEAGAERVAEFGEEGVQAQTSVFGCTMKTRRRTLQFAICVDNEGYPASLEKGKLYRVLP